MVHFHKRDDNQPDDHIEMGTSKVAPVTTDLPPIHPINHSDFESVPRNVAESSSSAAHNKPKASLSQRMTQQAQQFSTKATPVFRIMIYALLLIGWIVFLVCAAVINIDKSYSLIVIHALVCVGLLYVYVLKPIWNRFTEKNKTLDLIEAKWEWFQKKIWSKGIVKFVFFVLLLACFVTWLIIDSAGNTERLMSMFGLVFYLLLAVLCSKHPFDIQWRPVVWGLVLQMMLAILILRWPVGQQIFETMAGWFNSFIDHSVAGTSFVFGSLVYPSNYCVDNQSIFQPVFMFSVLMTVVFFSSVISLLYHWGVLQALIVRVAWLMQLTMGTTAAESLSAAGNIFVGQTEAPLLVKPYLSKMTKSELHAIMTAGFSTIAGTVFKIYVVFGACGNHLLSASVMSAPASLAIAKIVFPEKEESKTKKVEDLQLDKGDHANALDAVAGGATSGIYLVLNIAANLISFLACKSVLNAILLFLGQCVGIDGLSLEYLLGLLLYPCAWVMGPDTGSEDQTRLLAELIGVKTVVNEFVAYESMGKYYAAGRMTARTRLLGTYALCGFSNLGAVGVQLGGIGAMCPERRADLATVVIRALLAGSIACCTTACVAGMLTSQVLDCAGAADTSSFSCINLAVQNANSTF